MIICFHDYQDKNISQYSLYLKDIQNLIKILISILLIGEIQFAQKKNNNNDAVEIKNPKVIQNGQYKFSLVLNLN